MFVPADGNHKDHSSLLAGRPVSSHSPFYSPVSLRQRKKEGVEGGSLSNRRLGLSLKACELANFLMNDSSMKDLIFSPNFITNLVLPFLQDVQTSGPSIEPEKAW